MKEKTDALYDELFSYLKSLVERATERGATPAELQSVPEVARVLIDLITLQSMM